MMTRPFHLVLPHPHFVAIGVRVDPGMVGLNVLAMFEYCPTVFFVR
jgi:hypothetical protein